MKITIAEFLRQLYGNKRRKGSGKPAYEHPVDVVSNAYLDCVREPSRNIENEDGSSYIEGIVNNSDALIVKLADKIANMRDLVSWIKSTSYDGDALRIADRYIGENEQIIEGMKEIYPDLFDETFMYDHPLLFQADDFLELNEELKGLTT